MKIVFGNSSTLMDVLLCSKVSVTRVKDFIQEVMFTLDFAEQEIENINEDSVKSFNEIVLVDADKEIA